VRSSSSSRRSSCTFFVEYVASPGSTVRCVSGIGTGSSGKSSTPVASSSVRPSSSAYTDALEIATIAPTSRASNCSACSTSNGITSSSSSKPSATANAPSSLRSSVTTANSLVADPREPTVTSQPSYARERAIAEPTLPVPPRMKARRAISRQRRRRRRR
jgi:hypothetical protein